MADRTVRFYEVTLREDISNMATDYFLKSKINAILNPDNNGGSEVKSWSFDDAESESITIHILKNENDYVFCRIGKKKDSHSLYISDNDTQIATPVLSNEERKNIPT